MTEVLKSRKALIVITKSPYTFEHSLGGVYTALALADKGVKVSLLLIGDGVYCALRGQKNEKMNFEDLLYTVHSSDILIFVCRESLKMRGLKEESLIEVCEVVDHLDDIIDEYEHLLCY